MRNDAGSPTGSALFKIVSSALIAASPLLLLAFGMTWSWWIPGSFAWLAVIIYYGGVQTERGIWIAGTTLLTLATAIWLYALSIDHEGAILGVYFFYPLLTVVAAGSAVVDNTLVRSRNDVKKWHQ